jgi:glycerol 3-phosphatase-2
MSDGTWRQAAGMTATGGVLHEQFDIVLLDLDGVVYIGPDAVPGAARSLSGVFEAGTAVRFVTNNASRSPRAVAEHLSRLGIVASAPQVLTSAQVAAALLSRRFAAGTAVLVIGGEGLKEALAAEGLVCVESMDGDPSAVVQGFAPDIGWRRLAEATRAVRAGLYWMATNLDPTVPTVHGPAPGNGALVQVVAGTAGRGPDDVAGKPAPGAFLEAVRRAGSTSPLVVGDRLDTDLEGARAAGMPGLLVLTGVTGACDLLNAPPHRRPTYVGRDLTSLLAAHPGADVARSRAGAEGRCGGAVVRARPDGGRIDVEVISAGDDAVDLLRAAAVAAWRAADTTAGTVGDRPVDAKKVIAALHAVEPEASWAR